MEVAACLACWVDFLHGSTVRECRAAILCHFDTKVALYRSFPCIYQEWYTVDEDDAQIS